MLTMLRAVRRSWPLALLLGCVQMAPTQPPISEVASAPPTQPIELEEADAPEPVPVPPTEAPPESSESTEPPPESTNEGGHVVRPTDAITPSKGVPTIEQSEPTVGTTDADIIRRVVRRNINEVRNCYNQALAKDPTLAAKIKIEFTIGPSGDVEQAQAIDVDGLADPELPQCIADAIQTWTFPAPRGGGRVTVSYPFNLVPG